MKTAYYSIEEFSRVYKELGISEKDYESCSLEKSGYRTGVEVREDYTFTQLRLLTEQMDEEKVVNLVLIIKADAVYFVEISDINNLSKKMYSELEQNCSKCKYNVEHFIVDVIDYIIHDDFRTIEDAYKDVALLEKEVSSDECSEDFNKELLESKRYLLVVRTYYEQLIDVLEALEDNFNEILNPDRLGYISNMLRKLNRLKGDIEALIDLLAQLQATYSSHLDNKMNSTMKLLTIITTIFMPLTLIVGWYGMNFVAMPELQWSHGYIYVILLSIVLSLAVVVIAKVKKWF